MVFRTPLKLSVEETNVLILRAQKGDLSAEHAVIHASEGYVSMHARKHVRRTSLLGLLDLMNEGFLAVHRAIRTFDPSYAVRFQTYAKPWIQLFMRRAVGCTLVRLSAPEDVIFRTISDHFPRRRAALERQGVPPEQIDETLARSHRMTVETLHAAEALSLFSTSLDQPLGEETDASLHDVVATEDAVPADEQLADLEWRAHIAGIVARFGTTLSFTRRTVLEHRILGGKTCREVGTMIGCTGEKIRTVEVKLRQELRAILEASDDVEVEAVYHTKRIHADRTSCDDARSKVR